MAFSQLESLSCSQVRSMSADSNEEISKRPFLLVEDDSNDVYLLRLAFPKAGLQNPLHVVGNGAEAISYLSGSGEFADRNKFPVPAIVLLDLNLPGKDGFEVLKWLAEREFGQKTLVVVLTNSARKSDVNRAYALKANFFLTKPSNFDDLVEMTRCLHYLLRMGHEQQTLVEPSRPILGLQRREEGLKVDLTAPTPSSFRL